MFIEGSTLLKRETWFSKTTHFYRDKLPTQGLFSNSKFEDLEH